MNNTHSLSHELVRDRSQELGLVIFSGDYMGFAGLDRVSLAGSSLHATRLGLLLLDLVGVDSVEEVLSALGVLDVLQADVDALGEDLAAHALVDHHTHGALGHVEHTPGLAVVGLVGHALLESSTTWNTQTLSITIFILQKEHISPNRRDRHLSRQRCPRSCSW